MNTEQELQGIKTNEIENINISGTATANVWETEYQEQVIRNLSIEVSEASMEKLLNLLPEDWEDENSFTSKRGDGISAGRLSIFPEAGEIRVTSPQAKGARKGDSISFECLWANEGETVSFKNGNIEVKSDGFQIISLSNSTRNGKLDKIDELMVLGLSRLEAVQIIYASSVKA